MEGEKTNKTKTGLYWNVFLKIPYEIFRFVTSIFVARLLEPKDFGIVSIATIAIVYSNTFTNLGFNQALVQRKDITDKHINTIFTLDLSISMCLIVLFYMSSPFIASFFNSPESENVLKILSLIFVITTLHDIPYTLLRRDINFKVISIVTAVKEVFMSTLTLILAIAGYKYWAIVIGQLLPLCCVTIYLIYKSGWKPKIHFDHIAFKELFNFGAWSFVSSQIYFLSSRMDRIIIAKALNPSMLGLYDKARSLYQMPIESISSNINTVMYSSFSRSQDNKEELKKLFIKSSLLLSAINIPIYIGLISIADCFVSVLFGSKWIMMITPLQLLCLGGILGSLNGLIGNYIVSTGDFKKYTLRLLLATIAFFCIISAIVGYGIDAVAIAVALFSAVLFCLGFDIVRERINLKWNELISCVFPSLICSTLMYGIIKVWEYIIFTERNFPNMIALISIGVFTYTLSMILFPSQALTDLRAPLFTDLNKLKNKYFHTKSLP